jgi:tetratricopeptide (TPR) repeat protein
LRLGAAGNASGDGRSPGPAGVQRDAAIEEKLVATARLLFERQQLQEAEQVIDRVLLAEPDHVDALFLKGAISHRRHELAQAVDTYYRVLAVDPQHVEAALRIAEIQMSLGKPEHAAPLLRRVCGSSRATQDERAEARWALGIAYGCQCRWNDAAQCLAAAAIDRPSMTVDELYRLAYARFEAGQHEEALRTAGRVLEAAPQHAPARALVAALDAGTHADDGKVIPAGHSEPAVPAPRGW